MEARTPDTPLEGRSVDTPKGFDRRAKLAVDRANGFVGFGATLSGGELAALVAALAFVALVVFLAITLVRLHSTLLSLQAMVDDLHCSTVPVLQELRETVTTLNVEMDRVDGILSSAESMASSASNVASLVSTAVSNPLVKGLALLAGVGAGARRFRKARRRE